MNITTYGLDIAKRVFQLYWVDIKSGEIHNRKFCKQENYWNFYHSGKLG
jgi:hypothetical protein